MRLIGTLILLSGLGSTAQAQTSDHLGTRALGMAGAFVAVADDATAIYWNPAGLGTGDFFSFVVGLSRASAGDENADPRRRGSSIDLLVGTPPLGLGYYRLVTSTARTVGDGPADREGSHLLTHNAAVAVAQSVGNYLNLGATVRAVHGRAVNAAFTRASSEAVLDAIGDFQTTGSTTVDVDLGAMLRFERARVGLVARNLRQPEFEALGGGRLTADRQVRAGVAWFPARGLTISADADLTRREPPGDDWRGVAAGIERRVTSRVVLRGGIQASTAGDARPAASVGGSFALTSLLHADGYAMRGGADAPRGWGIGIRASF